MEGCRNYIEPEFDTTRNDGEDRWSIRTYRSDLHSKVVRKPIASYGKRSKMLAQLRSRIAWANKRDDDFTPPTAEAIASGKDLINSLVTGVLDFPFRIAISNDGEINFFFGNGPELFQILILDDGKLSYHAQSEAGELVGSGIEPPKFPHLRLFGYLNRD
jgi:hypothetical protein